MKYFRHSPVKLMNWLDENEREWTFFKYIASDGEARYYCAYKGWNPKFLYPKFKTRLEALQHAFDDINARPCNHLWVVTEGSGGYYDECGICGEIKLGG